MIYRFNPSQADLQYIYESATKRKEYHPDAVIKYEKLLKNQHFFNDEIEALQDAIGRIRKNPTAMWGFAVIEKDEEYYTLTRWIFVEDSNLVNACEYLGMAHLYDTQCIQDIAQDNPPFNKVIGK